jgi:hypothetical protein
MNIMASKLHLRYFNEVRVMGRRLLRLFAFSLDHLRHFSMTLQRDREVLLELLIIRHKIHKTCDVHTVPQTRDKYEN